MASNMMELMKSKFASMSKDELSLAARSANDDLAMGFMSSGDMQLIIAGNFVLQSCLRLGFCTQKLSQKQLWLMKELYRSSEETRNAQAAAAVEPITETDYQLIGKLAGANRQISEAMFNLIMCAAYSDGGLKKEVENKIDPIFGMLFLALFADSGLESVPAPPSRRPRVTGLEARVLDYMLNQKTMLPLNDIAKAFPGETKTTIKKALDGLCKKELVNWYANVILEPYGVEVDREDVDIVLSEKESMPVAKKTETPEEKEKREKAEAERKRKAAEAKAEEEKRKQKEAEEKKAYQKAVETWKHEVKKNETNRKNELDSRWTAHKKELISGYDKTLAEASAQTKAIRKKAEKKKAEAEKALSSLGMFKFSEKKAQKALIAEAEVEIAQAEQKLIEAKTEHDAAVGAVDKEKQSYQKSQITAVKKAFPLPKEPKKTEVILREEEATKKEKERKRKEAEEKARWERMTPQEKEKEKEKQKIKKRILASLEYGRKYRCAEIKALIPELAEPAGTARTMRLCCDLLDEGLLEKTNINNVIYFSLAE